MRVRTAFVSSAGQALSLSNVRSWFDKLTTNELIPIYTKQSRGGVSELSYGEVSELVDEHDLGSCAARRPGSSPGFPTRLRL